MQFQDSISRLDEQKQEESWQRHQQKMRELNAKLGIRWTLDSPELVGHDLESLAACYRADRHMNNIPLERWDRIARWIVMHGVSLAEGVCMQKQAARDLLKRERLIIE